MPTAAHFFSRYLPTVTGAGVPSPRPKVDEARPSCAPLLSVALDSATTCNRCHGPRESFVGPTGLEEPLNRRIRKTFHEIGPFLQLPIRHFSALEQMVPKLFTVLVRRNLLAPHHTATALPLLPANCHTERVPLLPVAAAGH